MGRRWWRWGAGLLLSAGLLAAILGSMTCGRGGALPAAPVARGRRPVPVPPGRTNLLAGCAWLYSGDDGRTWSPQARVALAGDAVGIQARATFHLPEVPADWVGLELGHNIHWWHNVRVFLNAREAPPPLEDMAYHVIPALPSALLVAGENELILHIDGYNRAPDNDPEYPVTDVTIRVDAALWPMTERELRIQTGPVLGAFGDDYFSVTCRTNLPAAVTLTARALDGDAEARDEPWTHPDAAAVSQRSDVGLFHRFRVPRPGGARRIAYDLAAEGTTLAVRAGPFVVSLPDLADTDRPLRLAVIGDARTDTDAWTAVASAVYEAQPDLVLFTGDMVDYGRCEWLWDEHFLGPGPARRLFASVPFYPVHGNHEGHAPMFTEMFYTPGADGRDLHWAQRVGPVLVVGIDGCQAWWEGSADYRWLEGVLAAQEDAAFVFVMSHYPAWSSGKYGRLDEFSGEPYDYGVRQSRQVILPLLKRYRATAFLVGHEHLYERSELPGGLMQFIAGGAGAPLRDKVETAEEQNPYSRAFAKEYHLVLLEVRGRSCAFRTVTPEGKTLDEGTLAPRSLPASRPAAEPVAGAAPANFGAPVPPAVPVPPRTEESP